MKTSVPVPDWIKIGLREKELKREEERRNRPINPNNLPINETFILEVERFSHDQQSVELTIVYTSVGSLSFEANDTKDYVNRKIVLNSSSIMVRKQVELFSEIMIGDQLKLRTFKGRLAYTFDHQFSIFKRYLTDVQRKIVENQKQGASYSKSARHYLNGALSYTNRILSHRLRMSPKERDYYLDRLKEVTEEHVIYQKKATSFYEKAMSLQGITDEDQYYS